MEIGYRMRICIDHGRGGPPDRFSRRNHVKLWHLSMSSTVGFNFNVHGRLTPFVCPPTFHCILHSDSLVVAEGFM
uniref:Uncharacterized protein n=1 Tax=Arundo donax TaxID=35708 RepID=A0A0A9CBJ0_ARUDO